MPIAQPAAASTGNQNYETPGAHRRDAQQSAVPQLEPEPEPEPQPRGPPRAELLPRPSSARPRPTGGARPAVDDDAAAQAMAGLQAARPRSAGVQGGQSRQRLRQQQAAAAARLSNPLVPAVRRGQRRSEHAADEAADAPSPRGGILGLRGRRPASAGPARQRPSSAGPRFRPQAQPLVRPLDGKSDCGGSGTREPATRASGSPRASAGQVPNSAETPRQGASSSSSSSSPACGVAAARRGDTSSQASSQQPKKRTAAEELMARRGLSPGGVENQQRQRHRPSSAPVRRSSSREEAQRAADARRSAAEKASGAEDNVLHPSRRAGWVSARTNGSDAGNGNGAGGRQSRQSVVSPGESAGCPSAYYLLPALATANKVPAGYLLLPWRGEPHARRVRSLSKRVQRSGRMRQRPAMTKNGAVSHSMPGSSPASHRIRQRNGFLRPSSAGGGSSEQRRPAQVCCSCLWHPYGATGHQLVAAFVADCWR